MTRYACYGGSLRFGKTALCLASLTETRQRVMGSGLEPPHPPVTTLILGPCSTSRNPAFWGRISPVFWALRCKVVGGWGGSAHYPDPTAQSVEPVYAERRAASRDRPGRLRGRPGSLGQT